jgi:hypothetical protein
MNPLIFAVIYEIDSFDYGFKNGRWNIYRDNSLLPKAVFDILLY